MWIEWVPHPRARPSARAGGRGGAATWDTGVWGRSLQGARRSTQGAEDPGGAAPRWIRGSGRQLPPGIFGGSGGAAPSGSPLLKLGGIAQLLCSIVFHFVDVSPSKDSGIEQMFVELRLLF